MKRYTPEEIAEVLRLPDSIGKEWFARGYYGTVSHNTKAVYQRYLGWYDANPWPRPITASGFASVVSFDSPVEFVVRAEGTPAPGARIADDAGVDMILVGDSLAMVVLGYDDTLSVTIDDMAHHTAAVARTKPSALIVGDLPWMSYHVSVEDTVRLHLGRHFQG